MRRRSLLRRVAVGRARATIIGVSLQLFSRDEISAKWVEMPTDANSLPDKLIQVHIGNQFAIRLQFASSPIGWNRMLKTVIRPGFLRRQHRFHPTIHAFSPINLPCTDNNAFLLRHQIFTLIRMRFRQATNRPITTCAIFKRHIWRDHWIVGLPRFPNRNKQRSRRYSGRDSCTIHIWIKHFYSLLPHPT